MNNNGGSNRSSSSAAEKLPSEDLQAAKNGQSSVTSVYSADIAGTATTVTVIWSRTLISHSLSVVVEQRDGSTAASSNAVCKIDLKPWRPFWSKKGLKALELDGGRRVEVFWDLRSARFSGRPEPAGGYYVALVSEEVVALLLGDSKKEAYRRTKARPSMADAALITRRDNVFGRKCFSTRARFGQSHKDNEIVVESSIAGGSPEPEMRIIIDGVVLVHVDNLRWKFRGNETVMVEKTVLHIYWDVHGWLFGSVVGLGQAVFIFKPDFPDPEYAVGRKHSRADGSGEVFSAIAPDFYFLLYASKVE